MLLRRFLIHFLGDAILTKSSISRKKVSLNNDALQHSNRRRGMLALGGLKTRVQGNHTKINTEETKEEDVLLRSNNIAKAVKPHFSTNDIMIGTTSPKNALNTLNTSTMNTSYRRASREVGGYGTNPFGAADDSDTILGRLSDLMLRSPEKATERILGGTSSSSGSGSSDDGNDEYGGLNNSTGSNEENGGLARADSYGSMNSSDGLGDSAAEVLSERGSSSGVRMSSNAPLYKARFSFGDQQKGTPPRLSLKSRVSGIRESIIGGSVEQNEVSKEKVTGITSVSMLNL